MTDYVHSICLYALSDAIRRRKNRVDHTKRALEARTEMARPTTFPQLQNRVSEASRGSGAEAATALYGLGGHAGALLAAHEAYLTEALDHDASVQIVVRELGALLCSLAQLATSHGLALEDIAQSNLEKVRNWAEQRDLDPLPPPQTAPPDIAGYQARSGETDTHAADGMDPLSLGVPILGLAGEVGTLVVAQKKAYRDNEQQASDPVFLTEELGDVLWYAAAVARHSRLDLAEVADAGVTQLEQLADALRALEHLPADLPVLDEGWTPAERFPRQLVIRFRERRVNERVIAGLTLVRAEPNAFPDGPVPIPDTDKEQGFTLGAALGASLTDNSRRADGYRYHDAIHLGILAVTGWSPTTRSLLQLKRRSDPPTNENEDGARAIFAEEGLAAVLAKRAPAHQGFLTERAVDDGTIQILTTVTEDLEVDRLPSYLWRRAVSQGFRAMAQLIEGRGGFLLVDLDKRSLTYSRTEPALELRA